MEKNNEEVKRLILSQEDIKTRISRNSKKYKSTIERVVSDIKNQNLRKGRVRPKNPDEAQIINKFKK